MSGRYDRRTFLRSLGLAAGFLPLLESEKAPAMQATSGYPRRLVVITGTNGVVPAQFYPPVGPITGPLPEVLSPLEPYKAKILALRAADAERSAIDAQVMIDQDRMYSGHYAYPALLTGTWKDGVSDGPSIDQLIADDLATRGVPGALLNLGVRPYSSSTSWKAAGQKNTPQTDPYRVKNALFAGVPAPPGATSGVPATPDALRERRRSVLDFVGSELEAFGSRLGSEDRLKIQAHLDAIRALELRLAASPGTGLGGESVSASCIPPVLPLDKPNFADVASYPTHVSMILALAGAAVKCDLARCITVDLIDDGGGNSLTFPWLDINSPDYHSLAHDTPSLGYEQKARIDKWFFEQIAAFIADLANTPEGEGSALDNTCVLVANDMNEGAEHYVGDLPYLIVGGAGGFFKQGQTVGLAENVPNNRLLTTLCHAMGLDLPSVGTYAGDLDSLLRA